MVDKSGAILIANHPFRYKLDPRLSFINSDHEPIDPAHPDRAAKLEIFRMVDAVEVLNGACSEEENLFALKVARHLGLAEVAGRIPIRRAQSDASRRCFPSRCAPSAT